MLCEKAAFVKYIIVPCHIDESRLPARFFRLVAGPSTGYRGKRRAGFEISTGSGDEMGELLVNIAKEIANGMLIVESTPQAEQGGKGA